MKLALFSRPSGGITPGVLDGDSIVDVSNTLPTYVDGQSAMRSLIDSFDVLRPQLDRLLRNGPREDLSAVKLHPPLPRPGKILNCIANYWEHAQREARPLNMFMKNPDAVIGPGDTIVLPEFDEPWCFMHEAELAVVIKGPAKSVKEADWRSAVFGYTCIIDVTARGEGRRTWPAGPPMSWLGKSFDTFAPLGPCIVTADEIEDPNNLHVQFWNNGELRHNYHTDDMEHRVPELIRFASTVMTLHSGDVISCGTNHEGLGFLQDGEVVEMCIHGIGRMTLDVRDPLRRKWERGIYMGADSTHHSAVKRHRPETVLRPSDASV